MIEGLIKNLVSELNVDNKQAEGGLGLLLGMAKDKLSDGDFSQVAGAFGGDVSKLMSAAPKKSGGGLGSSLLGMAGSALGTNSNLGALAGLATGFKDLNIDMDTVTKFVPIVLAAVKGQGGEKVSSILEGLFK